MLHTKSHSRRSVDEIIRGMSGIQLDIGCGAAKQDGFVGMDMRDLPEVDIVHNVTEFPWPLPDESVVRALASHLVEHIPPHNFTFVNFMNEVWRVMKPGGDFIISCPHGRSEGYLQDPTHCNPCNETTWLYFDPKEHKTNGLLWSIYKPKPWRIKILNWDPSANIEVVLVKRGDDDSE